MPAVWEVNMAHAVIFNELPATFPEKDEHKGRAAAGSIILHVLMISTVLLVPLLMPDHIEYARLVALIAPLPPPPPPPPPAVQLVGVSRPAIPVRFDIPIAPDALVMPTVIPRDITRIVDEPMGAELGGVIGGVPGGVAGGAVGGILHSILSSNAKLPAEIASPPLPPPPPPPAAIVAPPPPKPVAPAAPVRVGGDVREPKAVKVVPPIYPKLALKARIHGKVVLEATLTAEGTVDAIRVVSGHPMLIQAAVDAVKEWRYEPTYLNGEPVPVIFNATVNFELAPTT